MKTHSLLKTQCLTLLCLVLLTGCVAPPDTNNSMVTRSSVTPQNFQEPSSSVPNAVQSAIELSQKCAQLSEQLVALKQEKFALTTENGQLKTQVTTLEPDLLQAQKELGEANDLLLEMRLELNNWKDGILGFQSEMRDADQAQLEALLKILQLLGGEISTDPQDAVNDQNTSSASDSNV
jgi:uncharacterized phage infection (PIP) family protein YhgE